MDRLKSGRQRITTLRNNDFVDDANNWNVITTVRNSAVYRISHSNNIWGDHGLYEKS